MSVLALERYVPGAGPLHRLDARAKLIAVLAFILVAALLPPGSWLAYGTLFCIDIALLLASGTPGPLLRRTVLALPFVLVVAPTIVTREGDPVATLALGPLSLTATDAGIEFFASILVKSWLSVLAGAILAGTTPFPALAAALRSLRVPRIFVAIVSFMYRYLFVIGDEALRLHRARMARSAVVDDRAGGSIGWRAAVTGKMVGSLFLRSYERSERIYAAMLARGYDGEIRSLEPPALRHRDLALLAAMLVALSGVVTIGIVG